PAQILGVQSKPRGKGLIVKRAVAVVVVKRGGVVREIGFEKVELPVAVIVRNRRAHARLFAPVVVESRSGNDGHVRECAVMIVVVENARGAVAGNINVRPAVVIIVERGYAEAVMPVGLIYFRFPGHILKRAVAEIVIQK